MTPDIDLAVFDMIGTTVVDDGQVRAAFDRCLARQGIHLSPEDFLRWRGASKKDVLRHFIGQKGRPDAALRVETAINDFQNDIGRFFQEIPPTAIPGVEAAFLWLEAQGIAVVLTTGFHRETAKRILAAIGWEGRFRRRLVSGDDVAQGRPAPDMVFRAMEMSGVTDFHRVMVVGDTPNDIRAGRNAGVGIVVGVLTGGQGRGRLSEAGPDAITDSVADIPGSVFSSGFRE